MMLSSISTQGFSSLLVVLSIPFAQAWGKIGHEIVANIAYERLSPNTKAIVENILFPNATYNYTEHGYTTPMGVIASWADKVRYTKEYSWTTPLHFVDVMDKDIPGGCPSSSTPLTTSHHSSINKEEGLQSLHSLNTEAKSVCSFSYERDCKFDACAVGATVQFSHNLKNDIGTIDESFKSSLRGYKKEQKDEIKMKMLQSHNMTDIPQRESLMFLTHIVGDLHQPLHVSRKSDIGGNTIHVSFVDDYETLIKEKVISDRGDITKNGWNLHSIWDDGIIDYAMKHFYGTKGLFQERVEQLLDNKKFMKSWLSCDGLQQECTSVWAEESFADALTWAYGDENGNGIQDGATISIKYVLTRLPIVERRLAAAGVRLAASLEEIFDKRSFSLAFASA